MPPSKPNLSEQAYEAIRSMIVRLELAPGDILRDTELCERTGIGRTPVRESLQRLAREHFVTVIPRRGMYVSGIDVAELSMLFETRMVLEPYAARLAAARGSAEHWSAMQAALDEVAGSAGGAAGDTAEADDDRAGRRASSSNGTGNTGNSAGTTAQTAASTADGSAEHLLSIDRRCHELLWQAAGNRFLLDTLDMLYAQSDRLWHLYLADVADMRTAVAEHAAILDALRAGEGETAADLIEAHVRSFDAEIRSAVTGRLASPLAAAGA